MDSSDLLTESTVALRAQPFSNQLSIIEMIARVLPAGYKLYVREHPLWRNRYSYRLLAQLKTIPNVRFISTKYPAWEIVKNSKGILTLNGTNGIEALMYGKPVLAFAPNVYTDFHSGAIRCTNLFQLGAKLVELINTSINYTETVNYIQKLMSISSPVSTVF